MLQAGRAVAQRIDAGFPPWRPGFAYGQHVGFVVGQGGTGAGFLRVLLFPLPIIPPISPLS
jgi:NAD(P)H-hydrate repair Nnr-like enzyme with NAD(P)H-hydrate epimerase domain